MGKFGTLGVMEICLKMSQASREMANTEDLKDKIDEGGMIAIGIQPLTDEAAAWTKYKKSDTIILTCYSLKEKADIDHFYYDHLREIEEAMAKSIDNHAKRHRSEEWPEVLEGIGVTCGYDINDNATNKLLMRFFVFVSGEEQFARECCYAARKAIKDWTNSNTYKDNDGVERPCVWTPRIMHNPELWRGRKAEKAS